MTANGRHQGGGNLLVLTTPHPVISQSSFRPPDRPRWLSCRPERKRTGPVSSPASLAPAIPRRLLIAQPPTAVVGSRTALRPPVEIHPVLREIPRRYGDVARRVQKGATGGVRDGPGSLVALLLWHWACPSQS